MKEESLFCLCTSASSEKSDRGEARASKAALEQMQLFNREILDEETLLIDHSKLRVST